MSSTNSLKEGKGIREEAPEGRSSSHLSFLNRALSSPSVLSGCCAIGFLVYLLFFLKSLPLWFHPGWTTDDALQQWFPLYEVLVPGVFEGDLIYETMLGYLAPLHYAVCAVATLLTQDLIMASHWVMLVQLLLTSFFLFFGVRYVAGTPTAFFSLFWFLHTRQIVQRLTAGLPRGWSAVVITGFFYFAFRRNHLGVLVVLFAGCLTHPPTTLVCAGAYGVWLLWHALIAKTPGFRGALVLLIALSPLYAVMTYKVVERPDSIGQMVSYEEAQASPQFQFPDGRFPFLPHPEISEEWKTFAFQAFTGRFYKPAKFFRRYIREIVLLSFFALLLVAWRRRVLPFPGVLFAFLVSVTAVYLLSRPLAFKLYVPNRHLQFPLAFFWITAFPLLVWSTFSQKSAEGTPLRGGSLRTSWRPLLGFVLLGSLIWAGSSHGLIGSANFNYSSTKKGRLFLWAEEQSEQDAIFAGEPRLIDGMMLFGKRRAFATNETYHPFYPGYRKEIERRLAITFRAHYATSLTDLYEILSAEGIDYFVFDRRKFYPSALKEVSFYPPLDELVEGLASFSPDSYAYKQLPREVDREAFPPLVFRDEYSAIVDVAALGTWLNNTEERAGDRYSGQYASGEDLDEE
ncbi:hypothetical protein MRY87_11910 [bacterium]|nr:hypothetical protein [bacterium]